MPTPLYKSPLLSPLLSADQRVERKHYLVITEQAQQRFTQVAFVLLLSKQTMGRRRVRNRKRQPKPEDLIQQESLHQESLHQGSLQQEGLHQESLQQEGLHQEGLQQEGLHQESLHQEGLQQESLHQEGLQQEGLHQESLHQEGLHQEGLHQEGLQQEGLHQESLHQEGLQQESLQQESLHQEGLQQESLQQESLHQESLHQESLPQETLHQERLKHMVIIVYLSRHLVTDSGEGLQLEGLQPEGLQPEGLHQEGLQPEGLHQEGLQPEGLQPEGLLQDGLLQREGLQPEGLQQEGHYQEGPHQEGPQQEELHQESLHQESLQQESLHQEDLQAEARLPPRPDGTSMVITVYLCGPMISRHLVTDSGEGLQPEGLHQEGPPHEETPQEGLQEEGLQPEGLQPEGLQPEGLQEEGLQEGGLQPESLHQEGPQHEGTPQEGLQEEGEMVRTPGVLEAEEDAFELEMPTDHGNPHVVIRHYPIDAVVFILNQDQPPATALPGVVAIEEKPFVVMGCTEPVAPRNNTEISVTPNEEGEEPVQQPKGKSLGWRFLNWLSVVKEKEPNNKRNAGTNLKEDMEEHLISSKAYKRQAALLRTKLSMAEGEQMRMKIHRAERREQKEAQRLKEEQRYEQWAAERGLSDAGEGPADGPKKRMTRLQKVSLGLVALCQ
ncbi:PAX-interacting protein 1-like [Gadus morhua]|uniref:PAX-interacting protein 1-like n=1 Tax=Gadus morhua TaxID=8049 RepID=UPI0011B47620|nr:PAX-interacting protein 1-like [Gadus morhua]